MTGLVYCPTRRRRRRCRSPPLGRPPPRVGLNHVGGGMDLRVELDPEEFAGRALEHRIVDVRVGPLDQDALARDRAGVGTASVGVSPATRARARCGLVARATPSRRSPRGGSV